VDIVSFNSVALALATAAQWHRAVALMQHCWPNATAVGP
jgi:hypothetical protein